MSDVKIRVIGKDDASKKLKTIDNQLSSMAKSLGIAAAAAAVAKKAFDFAKESALLAARVETLGAVTQIMGQNAGITATEVRELEEGIQSMGITTQASRQALAQMMRAEIDLAHATDLARLAQDAAVISGDNSSVAFEKLTQIIGTGNTFMARRMGLLVDFEGAYKELADELGKSADELTQLERVQARTNEVMDQGTTIAGAYSAAMETGGKKISSYARHWEELKLEIGKGFQPVLNLAIDGLTDFTKLMVESARVTNNLSEARRLGIDVAKEFAIITDTELLYSTEEVIAAEVSLATKIENTKASREATAESHRLAAELYKAEADRIGEVNVAQAAARAAGYNLAAATDIAAEAAARAKGKWGGLAEELSIVGKAYSDVAVGIGNATEANRERIEYLTSGGGYLNTMDAAIQEAIDAGDWDLATKLNDELVKADIDFKLEQDDVDVTEAVERLQTELGITEAEAQEIVANLEATLFNVTARDYMLNFHIKVHGTIPGSAGGIGWGGGGGGEISDDDKYSYADGTGGWLKIPGPPGMAHPITVHGGEMMNVIPAGQSGGGGGGGISVSIHGPIYVDDGQDFLAVIGSMAQNAQRNAASAAAGAGYGG